MQRRTLAILLITGAILAILIVLFWLFGGKKLVQQPPPIVPSGGPQIIPSQGTSTKTGPAPSPTALREAELENLVKRRAMLFSARVGSYSNADGFLAIQRAEIDAVTSVQAFLEGQRKQLATAHPAQGTYFGVTTRAVVAKITDGLPVLSHRSVTVAVQVQKTQNNGDEQSIQYEEAAVSLIQNGSVWLVSRIEWKPFTQ
ncbi:MAG TPA: hypothetical protein VFQ60_00685 [Patescibacteria group bacterium]|nr:hypothetical protein [Patescibacteria group bacterium]